MIIDGGELRPQGAGRKTTRCTRYLHGQITGLLNLDIQRLGLRVTGGILNRQGIGGVFFGRHFHAAIIRRPDRVVLRLKLHGFGVGYPITQLQSFAAVDYACAGVETLDGQLLPSKLIDRLAVGIELLLSSFF